MVISCSKSNIEMLKDMILNNKIKYFTIEERSSFEKRGEFNIEYEPSDNSKSVELEHRLRAADVLDEFNKRFLEGKVIRFFMHYDIEGLKCIVSKAYKDEIESFIAKASDNILGDDLVHILTKALSVAEATGVKENVIPDITKKIKKEGGKPQYKEVKLGEVLAAVLSTVAQTEINE